MSLTSGYALIVPKSVTGRLAQYVIEAVESVCRSAQGGSTSRNEAIHTRDGRIGDDVKHSRVHICMDGPISLGVVARGDEDGVALGDRDGEHVDRELLNVGPVNLRDRFKEAQPWENINKPRSHAYRGRRSRMRTWQRQRC